MELAEAGGPPQPRPGPGVYASEQAAPAAREGAETPHDEESNPQQEMHRSVSASYHRAMFPASVAFSAFMLLSFLVPKVSGYRTMGIGNLRDVAVILSMLSFFIGGVMPRFVSALRTQIVVEGLVIGFTVSALLADWHRAAVLHQRIWNLCVIAVDIALVGMVRQQVFYVTVAAVMLWITIERIESASHFGLYHVAQSLADEKPSDICECADPPCASVTHLLDWFPMAAVFVVDAMLTRRFAQGMRERTVQVEAAIRVAEKITTLLTRYQTDEAMELVESSSGSILPGQLLDTYRKLLENLICYKVYLPSAFFDGQSDTGARIFPADEETNAGSDFPSTERTGDSGHQLMIRGKSARPAGRRRVAQRVQLLPRLQRRSAAVACSRLGTAAVAEPEANPAAVSAETSVFLSAVLPTAKAYQGVMQSFSDRGAIMAFGALHPSVSACGDAVCYAALVDTAVAEFLREPIIRTWNRYKVPHRPFYGIWQGVDWDCMLAGEVGTCDRKSFGMLGAVIQRVCELCNANEQLGTTLLCTQRVWDRMQSEPWVSAREIAGYSERFELKVTGAVPPPGDQLAKDLLPAAITQSVATTVARPAPVAASSGEPPAASPLVPSAPQPGNSVPQAGNSVPQAGNSGAELHTVPPAPPPPPPPPLPPKQQRESTSQQNPEDPSGAVLAETRVDLDFSGTG
eukprot:TRINITY_DN15311_c0_g1_i1.p1 TRINITY_DN15311_c0_g1~~TRINITY_DN15311_c0_g1_i1.p1  ORF type:complete len:687 (+),score=171.50 TRINITY_DN15311_c0_g1_i1:83-2143(+)